MSIFALLIIVALLVVIVILVVVVNKRKPGQPPYYGPPGGGYPQPPMPPPYGAPPAYPPAPPAGYPPPAPGYPPPPGPVYAASPAPPPVAPPAPPPPPPGVPAGYQPQPQDQAVTAANGYQLLLPQFQPNQQAIISIAVVAQGKVYFRALMNGGGVFGGGLDIVSGRRQGTEDVLSTVRRILAEETGWTGRPLATVGNAQWDLGSGKENEVCYAVLLDLPPNGELPSAGMTTWASRADLPTLKDLGPRAQVACDFAANALSAAGY